MISVVIRTYNECKYLEKVLKILRYQSLDNEVIVIDSNSPDDTKTISKKYDAKVIQCIPFNYGKAINVGIKESSYGHICILSAHCHPINDSFLEILYSNFHDERVAGVYGKNIPGDTNNIIDKRDMLLMHNNEKREETTGSSFNNAASMIKKSIWNNFPFQQVRVFEDKIWANQVQRSGYKIIYEPKAIVIHYHKDTIEDTLKKYKYEYEVLKELEYV